MKSAFSGIFPLSIDDNRDHIEKRCFSTGFAATGAPAVEGDRQAGRVRRPPGAILGARTAGRKSQPFTTSGETVPSGQRDRRSRVAR